jgi:phosphatidate cytidylyltransferase
MLRWRLLLGVLIVAGLIGLCWLDHQKGLDGGPPGVVLLPLALLISLAASGEVISLLAAADRHPVAWVIYVGNALVVLSNVPALWMNMDIPPLLGPMGALAVVVCLAFLAEMRRYREPGGVMDRLALSIFGVVYVGFLLSFLIQMRLLGQGRWGIAAIASLIIVVKMCDIGAYTFGRLFGRHKMAPVLSPGKTWEGVAGGLALACVGSYLGLVVVFNAMVDTGASPIAAMPPWGWLAYGLVVGTVGILGDLAESLFKRDVGRKDSSHWMPGFGGVLDLLDSILLAAPIAYLAWTLGLVGP